MPAAPIATSVWPLRHARPMRVGDDDGDVARRAAARDRRAAGRRWRRGRRQQRQLVGAHVGRVDAGGGLHDAQLVSATIMVRPRRATIRSVSAVDERAARASRAPRGRSGTSTSRPSALENTLQVTTSDVAVDEPGRRLGQRRGQVVAGAELGQPRHRQQLQRPGRAVPIASPAIPARSSASATIWPSVVRGRSSAAAPRGSATPGTSAASPVCTSQPSSRPPSARAP